MKYQLRHRTTYSYDAPVDFARCVLRLTPESSSHQTVLQHGTSVKPSPANSVMRRGPFDDLTTTVTITEPHWTLMVEARSTIEVHARPVPVNIPGPAWREIKAAAGAFCDLSPCAPAHFLYPTERTPLVKEITDYARESFAAHAAILHAATDLMARIHRDFTFDPMATDVTTPPAQAFAARRGVCQDFAHIMISGLKGLGLPCAYISGYLRTVPPPGQARLEGADATHAWVAVWAGPELGWVGFDPTNNLLAQNDHIILATGRDYSDVPPIEGVLLGQGGQALKVEVDVEPQNPA